MIDKTVPRVNIRQALSRLRRTPAVRALARRYRRVVLALTATRVYDQDGLRSIHNHEFMLDPTFVRAYRRGVRAAGDDHHWHWRVHIALWAAAAAAKLSGDFVECGVSRGFMSSAIMDYLDWNSQNRTFYLLDSFQGIDERYVTAAERASGIMRINASNAASGLYTFDATSVRANFAEWKNVKLIVGTVPDALPLIEAQRIAFLHLDLNSVTPEAATLDYLWDKLVPGALVLMDDYAFYDFPNHKPGLDAVARARGTAIASLPTGQGLLIKPP